MTNEQLCVLLLNYETHIWKVIEQLEEACPDSMKVKRQPIIGPSYEEVPELEEIKEFANNLSEQINELRGSDKNEK
ncbi:hypothetical protein [Idiomarina abyssalis]|uniref:hypothetical protein n=1 Tax=Idiomarina abyssalis TaxID=86102 RepID=UPI001CD3E5B3|nr:hypothetical protein [Idiomarina abyssalis]